MSIRNVSALVLILSLLSAGCGDPYPTEELARLTEDFRHFEGSLRCSVGRINTAYDDVPTYDRTGDPKPGVARNEADRIVREAEQSIRSETATFRADLETRPLSEGHPRLKAARDAVQLALGDILEWVDGGQSPEPAIAAAELRLAEAWEATGTDEAERPRITNAPGPCPTG